MKLSDEMLAAAAEQLDTEFGDFEAALAERDRDVADIRKVAYGDDNV